jgi:hypothetical protein
MQFVYEDGQDLTTSDPKSERKKLIILPIDFVPTRPYLDDPAPGESYPSKHSQPLIRERAPTEWHVNMKQNHMPYLDQWLINLLDIYSDRLELLIRVLFDQFPEYEEVRLSIHDQLTSRIGYRQIDIAIHRERITEDLASIKNHILPLPEDKTESSQTTTKPDVIYQTRHDLPEEFNANIQLDDISPEFHTIADDQIRLVYNLDKIISGSEAGNRRSFMLAEYLFKHRGRLTQLMAEIMASAPMVREIELVWQDGNIREALNFDPYQKGLQTSLSEAELADHVRFTIYRFARRHGYNGDIHGGQRPAKIEQGMNEIFQ